MVSEGSEVERVRLRRLNVEAGGVDGGNAGCGFWSGMVGLDVAVIGEEGGWTSGSGGRPRAIVTLLKRWVGGIISARAHPAILLPRYGCAFRFVLK